MIKSIYIQNLRCGGCASTIAQTLSKLNGIADISVNTEENKISFSSSTTSNEIEVIMALKKIGYPPRMEPNTIGYRSKALISCIKGKI